MSLNEVIERTGVVKLFRKFGVSGAYAEDRVKGKCKTAKRS